MKALFHIFHYLSNKPISLISKLNFDFLFLLLFLFFPCFIYGITKPIELLYSPCLPVIHKSDIHVRIIENIDNWKLSGEAYQYIESELSLLAEQSNLPVSHFPMDLKYVLKDLTVDLHLNDQSAHFAIKDFIASLYLAQASRMVNRPIILHFDSEGRLQAGKDFQKLLQELPWLAAINPEAMLATMLHHLFALASQELTTERSYSRIFYFDSEEKIPINMHYFIKQMTDHEVTASFEGILKEQAIPLEANQTIVLSGRIIGEGTWNRSHALIHQIKARHVYEGFIHVDGQKYSTSIEIDHQVQTTKKN